MKRARILRDVTAAEAVAALNFDVPDGWKPNDIMYPKGAEVNAVETCSNTTVILMPDGSDHWVLPEDAYELFEVADMQVRILRDILDTEIHVCSGGGNVLYHAGEICMLDPIDGSIWTADKSDWWFLPDDAFERI